MAVYAVFEPPQRDRDMDAHAARFAFVRDGFSWGAFIFGIVWMLWHRLWLVSALFVIVLAALAVAASTAHLPAGLAFAIWFLIKLLVGLEASTLRRWTLERRKWRDLGIVVANNAQTAERRFFDHWVEGNVPPPSTRASSTLAQRPSNSPPQASDIIGLFPEPGAQR